MTPTIECSPEDRIMELARTFPTLAKMIGTRWDPELLDANSFGASSGEVLCIQFILAIWDDSYLWKCGKFDFFASILGRDSWDYQNKAAFRAWLANPFTV